MNRFLRFSKTTGSLLSLGLFLLVLQGCQKPFIEISVDATAQACEKGTGIPPDNPPAGCPPPTPVSSPTSHDGIVCNTGHICSAENATCARGKKCDTQFTSGSSTNCTCACVSNPN